MLCKGLMQARDDHISQKNIQPVHYFYIGVPIDVISSTQKSKVILN